MSVLEYSATPEWTECPWGILHSLQWCTIFHVYHPLTPVPPSDISSIALVGSKCLRTFLCPVAGGALQQCPVASLTMMLSFLFAVCCMLAMTVSDDWSIDHPIRSNQFCLKINSNKRCIPCKQSNSMWVDTTLWDSWKQELIQVALALVLNAQKRLLLGPFYQLA